MLTPFVRSFVMRSLLKIGWVILALAPGPAFAQLDGGFFADDFERLNLLLSDLPAGRWNVRTEEDSNSIAQTNLAAHRGVGGLRVTDANSAMGARNQRAWVEVLGLDDSQTRYRLRYWARVAPTAMQTDSFMTAALATANNTYLIELSVGGDTSLSGHDQSDLYSNVNSPLNIADGGWHLVEGVLGGLQTSNGTRELFIDGTRVLKQSTIDFAGTGVARLKFGKVYDTNSLFLGTTDFDDVRASPNPQASRLSLQLDAGTPGAAACAWVRVNLINSEDGGLAPAPYDVTASLNLSPAPISFFTDATCSIAAPVFKILPGSTGAQTFARFAPGFSGAVNVTATFVDFLSASGSLTIPDAGAVPDGGTDGGSGGGTGGAAGGTSDAGSSSDAGVPPVALNLGLGCGCASNSAGPPGWLAGVLLLAFSRRRSGPRPGTRARTPARAPATRRR